MINIKQIGNGSAFNHKMTNSSFLIKDSNKAFMMLFDCGESVFAELRRQDDNKEINLDELTDVFISHMDSDHIGSIKTLIYYMYFARNKVLRIRFAKSIEDQVSSYLSDINSYKEFGEFVPAQLFIKIPFEGESSVSIINFLSVINTPSSYVMIAPIKAYHGKSCFGLSISTNESIVIITGDTTVSYNSHNIFKDNNNMKKPKKFICFHDFSPNFDQPEKQVHACKTSMEKDYYTPEFLDRVIPYHDDRTDFHSTWFSEVDIDLIVEQNNYNLKYRKE